MFAESTLLSAAADTAFDFQKPATEDTFHRLIQNMIKKFQHEPGDVQRCEHKYPIKKKIDLLEVVCSPQSELVSQNKLWAAKHSAGASKMEIFRHPKEDGSFFKFWFSVYTKSLVQS